MLITKEVEIDVSSGVKQYYLNKGYEIPQYFNKKNNRYTVKRGTKIWVKVEDLDCINFAAADLPIVELIK